MFPIKQSREETSLLNGEGAHGLPFDDKRSPTRQGPKKLVGIKKAANDPGKGIKAPKGLTPGDNFKRKK